MSQFKQIFKKVGGFEILRQYLKSHVLVFSFIEVALLGLSRKSLEIVRLATTHKKMLKLRKKYRHEIESFKQLREHKDNTGESFDRKIWVCWLQGIDNAPPIVKRCLQSLKQNICDREIVLITRDNFNQYVELPDFIINKYEKGIIGNAHFSDILRLKLLITYGGTWIDSTVLCTSNDIPSYMLDDDLFVFRTLKPGLDGHPTSVSNWFITSKQHNEILELTLKLLYTYWERNDSLIDYYIFHMFFELAAEAYPDQWKRVIPVSNELPHMLLLRLFDDYDEKMFESIINQICFHKLTYKFTKEDGEKDNTNYQHMIKM